MRSDEEILMSSQNPKIVNLQTLNIMMEKHAAKEKYNIKYQYKWSGKFLIEIEIVEQ